jgi:predicted DNA-binding ribbon-helix-helix protein
MAEGTPDVDQRRADFWEQFRLIVIERRTTISNLLTEIERTMRLLPYQGKGCDRTLILSAAVRVFVLRTVMSQSSSRRGDKPGVSAVQRRSRSPWSLPPGTHSKPQTMRMLRNVNPDFPDLNRLFTDCVWDADAGRWERKQ